MTRKKLNNAPLYDAVIEIRFETSIPPDAMPGILYSKLATDFQEGMVSLPASQLPKPIRDRDPNLKYQPTHKFMSEEYYLNVGANVMGFGFSASNGREYPGWKPFFSFYKSILRKVDSHIVKINRLGVRYINFFQAKEILDQLNVTLKTGWEEKAKITDRTVMFVLNKEKLKSRVSISDGATISFEGGSKEGQVIDIDTYLETEIPLEDLSLKIEEAHGFTEDIFFSLPNSKLMKTLEGPADGES